LYAVGAFLALTLSQAGMVGHWRRVGGKGATRSMLINGLGAFATGITVIVVLVAKFVEGAWITVLLIPGLLLAMRLVRRHYHAVFLEVRSKTPLELTDTTPPLVILPVQGWNRIVKKALRLPSRFLPTSVPFTSTADRARRFFATNGAVSSSRPPWWPGWRPRNWSCCRHLSG